MVFLPLGKLLEQRKRTGRDQEWEIEPIPVSPDEGGDVPSEERRKLSCPSAQS